MSGPFDGMPELISGVLSDDQTIVVTPDGGSASDLTKRVFFRERSGLTIDMRQLGPELHGPASLIGALARGDAVAVGARSFTVESTEPDIGGMVRVHLTAD